MSDEQHGKGTVGYLMETGALKRGKRTGWWIAGIKDPETIAEHSFRVAVVGSVLAMMEGADAGKVALMCTFHDTQETRIGDIPWIGRRYLTAAKNEDVTADQVADAHDHYCRVPLVSWQPSTPRTPSTRWYGRRPRLPVEVMWRAALPFNSRQWPMIYAP